MKCPYCYHNIHVKLCKRGTLDGSPCIECYVCFARIPIDREMHGRHVVWGEKK